MLQISQLFDKTRVLVNLVFLQLPTLQKSLPRTENKRMTMKDVNNIGEI